MATAIRALEAGILADSESTSMLLDLLTWTSPAWPIGAFAFSSGLEWACEGGYLRDATTTLDWIGLLLSQGAIWNDVVFLVHAYRATSRGDHGALREIVDLARACATSVERRLETSAQGAAFRRIARSTYGPAPLAPLDTVPDDDLAYPVVFACLAAARSLPISPVLTGYLHGVAANLVSAAQRLVPLGQTNGQAVLQALRPLIAATAHRAATVPDGDLLDQIGGATLMADLGSMAHETQYTRLFRT